MSQFNFELKFRTGKNSARPDALSRRKQDMPASAEDERMKSRETQLLKDSWMTNKNEANLITKNSPICSLSAIKEKLSCNIPKVDQIFHENNL